jgi:hypothetical protein
MTPWLPAESLRNQRYAERSVSTMTRGKDDSRLVVGYAPDAVDFTDAAAPPGLNEDLVAEGIKGTCS